MYRIETFKLLQKAFGLAYSNIKWYDVKPKEILQESENPYNIQEFVLIENEKTSALGTPIVMPVTFLAGKYKSKDDNGDPVYIDYDAYDLPPVSITEFNQPKRIVKTAIAGNDGTIKEYIGKDDVRIDFKGLIVNDDLVNPPENEILAIQALYDVPDAVAVQGDLFEWLGIEEVVIEDLKIFQIEGFQHVVGYSMRALSDRPIEAKLKLRSGI